MIFHSGSRRAAPFQRRLRGRCRGCPRRESLRLIELVVRLGVERRGVGIDAVRRRSLKDHHVRVEARYGHWGDEGGRIVPHI